MPNGLVNHPKSVCFACRGSRLRDRMAAAGMLGWRTEMEYSVGRVGRVVVARLFEGEDLHACVEQIAREGEIRCAVVLITGGFRTADVVVGPRQEQPRIEPRFQAFTGPGEVLGVGMPLRSQERHEPAAPDREPRELILAARSRFVQQREARKDSRPGH